MTCPHCSSARIAARNRRSCNERTDGSFNHLQYPTDVVTMAIDRDGNLLDSMLSDTVTNTPHDGSCIV